MVGIRARLAKCSKSTMVRNTVQGLGVFVSNQGMISIRLCTAGDHIWGSCSLGLIPDWSSLINPLVSLSLAVIFYYTTLVILVGFCINSIPSLQTHVAFEVWHHRSPGSTGPQAWLAVCKLGPHQLSPIIGTIFLKVKPHLTVYQLHHRDQSSIIVTNCYCRELF